MIRSYGLRALSDVPAKRVIDTKTGGHDRTQHVAITKRKNGYVWIAGSYIRQEKPIICGESSEICGCEARYLVTILQTHETRMSKSDEFYPGEFKNFLLLCPSCLELYRQFDTMVAEPIDLQEWFSQNGLK